MEKTYLFEKEIRIFGIKRSGIHAISNWIYSHFAEEFFTNVILLNNTNLSLKGPHKSKKKSREIIKLKIATKQRKKAFKFPLKAFIVITENFDLKEAIKKLENKKSSYNVLKKYYAKYYGFDNFSKDIVNILIYRSCFNQIASLLQYYQTTHSKFALYSLLYMPVINHLNSKIPNINFLDMKTQYELEALEVTNILKDKIVIFYDRWFVDIEYRKQISKKLGLAFTDNGLNFIWKAQSSFEGDKRINKQGCAQQMKVLDRYKILEPVFKKEKELIIQVKKNK